MSSQRSFLLLNASNLKSALMYPYAFVQISEIASRFGIHSVPHDLYGIPEDQWEFYLHKLLQKNSYDMVLITLRNTDAVDVIDYQLQPTNFNYHHPAVSQLPEPSFYYPIEATKHLIQVLRKLTDLPIIIGGYGFSVMPEKLMKYLQPNYGVQGEPDAFFEHFEDMVSGQNLDQIANLVYNDKGILKKGPSKFFPPASRPEYTDRIIADRQAFYSRFAGEGTELSVPIEVSRGCSKQCSFCSEPLIKGRRVKYRDLDVIEDEINFLRKYQLNQLFFVCSEINTEGNEFVMNLTDRLLKINENRKEYEKISWYTLHLMTLSEDELKTITKAGFRGGSNDVISLDDRSLKAVKPPVKSTDVINFFSLGKKVVKEAFRNKGKKFYSLEERIFRAPQLLNSDDFMRSWNIFLGHIPTTPETIRVTLKRAGDAGLIKLFDSCYVNKATRIYDYIQPTEEALKHTWSSVNGIIKNSYNELWPSFTYPPALLRHFGSTEILDDFFVLIGDTYLSQKHLFKKDWNWFLGRNVEPKTFLSWWIPAIKSEQSFDKLTSIPEVLKFLTFLRNNPFIDNIKLFFNPTPGRKKLLNFAANLAIQFILFSLETEIDPIMEHIGLPPLKITLNLSPYKFASKIFEYYSNKDELFSAVNDSSFTGVLSSFLVEYLLYLNNTPLGNEYKIFFI
ncbi:MAG: B12-binding domain-containing radical SAM protein [Candidatus Hodarchaeota archaeon]